MPNSATTSIPFRVWKFGIAVYVLSRILVLLGLGVVAVARTQEDARNGLPRLSTLHHIRETLVSWDGFWYLEIASSGYPSNIPANVTYFMLEARAAFFPGFPMVIRMADAVLPWGQPEAALIANIVLGATAVLAVGALAYRLHGERAATLSMAIFSMFPGSFALSMAYSEALMITFSSLALLLLVDERWLLAGLAGAIATMTRPNALAIGLACLAAAWVHRQRIRAVIGAGFSAVCTGAGFVVSQLVIAGTAQEAGAWFRVQREAWSEGFSFGVDTVRLIGEWIATPLGSPTRALTVGSILFIAVGLWALARSRLHPIVASFSIGIVSLTLLASTTTPRPRFTLTAVGLFIAISVTWINTRSLSPERRRSLELAASGISGALLVTVTAIYGLLGAIP